jgi:streptogramin lyase
MNGSTTLQMLVLLALVLTAACTPVQHTADTMQPTAEQPTPQLAHQLTPAVEYADSISAVPEGYALFIELWNHYQGEGACSEIMIDFPTYDYSGDILSGEEFYETPNNRSRVIIGSGNSVGGTAGGGISSGLTAVDRLPFILAGDSPQLILRAVASDGSLVVDIDGHAFWIHAGSDWEATFDGKNDGPWKGDADCRVVRMMTLTNYGLLRDADIELGYWDGVKVQPFRPGMIEPTPVVIPCTVYQPLGAKGYVWDIEIGEDGAVWATASGGAAQLDPQTGGWKTLGQGEGLQAGNVRFVTLDADGTAWLGFWDGPLYYFDGKQWETFDGSGNIQAEIVIDVAIAPDGSVWFATNDNGVYQWERKTDTWQHFTETDGLHSNGVSSIQFAPDSKVWFSSRGGVSYLAPTATAVGEATWWSQTGLAHTAGYDVTTTSADGKVWFGGQRYFDHATQSWAETVYQGFAYDVAVDGSGGLWVATEDGAIYIPDPDNSRRDEWQHYTTANGLGGNSTRSLAIAADGAIWFGAENATVTRCEFGQ